MYWISFIKLVVMIAMVAIAAVFTTNQSLKHKILHKYGQKESKEYRIHELLYTATTLALPLFIEFTLASLDKATAISHPVIVVILFACILISRFVIELVLIIKGKTTNDFPPLRTTKYWFASLLAIIIITFFFNSI